MSYWPLTCPLITVSLLVAGVKATCRPSLANSPSYSATKKPAESRAGTTATFRSGFSMPDVAAASPTAEHPLANTSAAAAASRATPRTRLAVIAKPLLAGMGAADARQAGRLVAATPPVVLEQDKSTRVVLHEFG